MPGVSGSAKSSSKFCDLCRNLVPDSQMSTAACTSAKGGCGIRLPPASHLTSLPWFHRSTGVQGADLEGALTVMWPRSPSRASMGLATYGEPCRSGGSLLRTGGAPASTRAARRGRGTRQLPLYPAGESAARRPTHRRRPEDCAAPSIPTRPPRAFPRAVQRAVRVVRVKGPPLVSVTGSAGMVLT